MSHLRSIILTAVPRELLNTMHKLSDHSLTATRRLDDIYYSILEKFSTLRNTISSLQELSDLTKDLHHDFEEEAKENTNDIQAQIDALANFSAQQKKVTELEERIQRGRERAVQLDDRLANCKERVAWIDKRDREETEKTGRFYKMMWTILASAVALLVVVKIVYVSKVRDITPSISLEEVHRMVNFSDMAIPEPVREMLEGLKEGKSKVQLSKSDEPMPVEVENDRLRAFDDL